MSKIDLLVSDFVVSLRKAIADEAAAAFASVAGGGAVSNRGARRGRKPGPKPRRRLKSVPADARKRTSEQVENQAKTLLAAIKKTPGLNIEGLAKETGISSKELALPVLKLWDMKPAVIRTVGQKRGTKYFPK
jgi:hypothetical protein